MERDLVREINDLRRSPSAYAEKLVKNKQYFNDKKVWKHPDAEAGIKTEEGPAAYDEAILFLRTKAEPQETLTPSKGLNRVAADFLAAFQKDVEAKVDIGEVVQKYGEFTGNFRRLAQFGSPTAEQVIVNLVVCDGDKSRGHRDALLAPFLKKVGVAFGNHETYKVCSVIVACTTFDNKVDADDTVN